MTSARALALGLLLVALAPANARAEGFFIPFAGVNFAGDSGKELSDALDAGRLNWGASLGYMGGGVFGVEGDVGFSPDFYGTSDVGGSSALTVMGNLLLGVPLGGQSGFGVRPYGVVGVGLVRTRAEIFDAFAIDNNQAAWNFGGGVMIFFGPVGVRADVRYFRTFGVADLLDIDVLEERGSVDFGRASAGFIIRF